jgi:hypothetical protein
MLQETFFGQSLGDFAFRELPIGFRLAQLINTLPPVAREVLQRKRPIQDKLLPKLLTQILLRPDGLGDVNLCPTFVQEEQRS